MQPETFAEGTTEAPVTGGYEPPAVLAVTVVADPLIAAAPSGSS